MLDVFLLTLDNVGTLLIYIAIGYFLQRKHLLPEQAGRMLSLLCVMIFTPAYNIINLSKNIRMEMIGEKLLLIGWGVVYMAIAVILGRLLARPLSRTPIEKSSLTYAFTFSNFAYFGYPVIEGVFGSALLADFMIFGLPVSMMNNSYGYLLFQEGKKFSIKRILKTPVIIGMIIGIVIGLSGIKLPLVFNKVLTGLGNCMSPSTMLLAGFMLGKFPLRHLFSGIRAYLMTAIRMLGIPLIIGIALFLCGVRGISLFWPLVIACLPLGLNLVVFPESLGFEKEAEDNAQMCFVSYVLALAILPCVFSVITWLCT